MADAQPLLGTTKQPSEEVDDKRKRKSLQIKYDIKKRLNLRKTHNGAYFTIALKTCVDSSRTNRTMMITKTLTPIMTTRREDCLLIIFNW